MARIFSSLATVLLAIFLFGLDPTLSEGLIVFAIGTLMFLSGLCAREVD